MAWSFNGSRKAHSGWACFIAAGTLSMRLIAQSASEGATISNKPSLAFGLMICQTSDAAWVRPCSIGERSSHMLALRVRRSGMASIPTPKVSNKIAQGNALGHRESQLIKALKGRRNDSRERAAQHQRLCRPFRA